MYTKLWDVGAFLFLYLYVYVRVDVCTCTYIYLCIGDDTKYANTQIRLGLWLDFYLHGKVYDDHSMKSIRDTCMEFFQSEDMKRDVKAVLQPMFGMVYNELYPYLWFLCIYHVFLIFLVVANLVLLLRGRGGQEMKMTDVLDQEMETV